MGIIRRRSTVDKAQKVIINKKTFTEQTNEILASPFKLISMRDYEIGIKAGLSIAQIHDFYNGNQLPKEKINE